MNNSRPCITVLFYAMVTILISASLSNLFAFPDFSVRPKDIEHRVNWQVYQDTLRISNSGDEDLEWGFEVEAEVENWISASPNEGVVQPGQDNIVVVIIDGRDVEEDHVYAFLNFTSNDPTRREYTVPVVGHTVAYPRIEVTWPEAWEGDWNLVDMNMIFEDGIFWGEEYSFNLTIMNRWGGATLVVEDLPCNNGHFGIDPTEFELNHNGSRQITITLDGEEVGYHVATITSVSSAWDPRELNFRVSADVSHVFRIGTQIPDVEMNEDDEETLIADLDTVFISSFRGAVEYQFPAVLGLVPRIERNGEFFLRPRANWNGISDVILTAAVEDTNFADLADTFRVTVQPMPDAPAPFDLLLPADGETIHPTEYDSLFVWQASNDIDGDTDTVRYSLTITPEDDGDEVTWDELIDTTLTTMVLGEVLDLNAGGTFTWTVRASDGEFERDAWSTFSNYLAPAGVGEDELVTTSYELARIYPNPFNSSLNINIHLREADRMILSICDLEGRLVTVLHNGLTQRGEHCYIWNPAGISSGKYLIYVETGERKGIHPVVLSR